MIEKRILLAFLFVGLPLFVSAQNKEAASDTQNDWIVEANNPNSASLDLIYSQQLYKLLKIIVTANRSATYTGMLLCFGSSKTSI